MYCFRPNNIKGTQIIELSCKLVCSHNSYFVDDPQVICLPPFPINRGNNSDGVNQELGEFKEKLTKIVNSKM